MLKMWTITAAVCLLSVVALTPSVEGSKDKDEGMKFLMSYGYLPRSDMETGQLRSPEEVTEAIMTMQRKAHLPLTGKLDSKTMQKMRQPRCGMPDMEDSIYIKRSSRLKRYVLWHSKWEHMELTWRLERGTPDLSDSLVKQTLVKAFQFWGDQSQLSFRMDNSGDVDILVKFGHSYHGDPYPFDGEGRVLAHAFYPGTSYAGDLHFDEAEYWTIEKYTGQNLLYVAVHEIGHALGLRHSDVEDSIMYPYARGYDPKLKLYPDDIAGIQNLYGKPHPSTPRPTAGTPRPTTSTTTKPTTTTTSVPPKGCPQKMDALSVIRGETFIFKDNMCWRYNYRGLVPGFPLEFHRFWNLPADVDHIDAVYVRPYTGRYKIVFFSGQRIFEFDDNIRKVEKSLGDLGLPNDIDKIDAAFVWGLNDMTYLVSGDKYWKYNDTTGRVLPYPDYPRPMSMWRGVPVPVDAAYEARDRDGNERTYFFKGLDAYELDNMKMQVRSDPKPPPIDFWTVCFSELVGSKSTSLQPIFSTIVTTTLLVIVHLF